jgi:hypothetical protein
MNLPASAYEFIDNHSIVRDVFGQWPGFHDGEVHRLVMDSTRRRTNGSEYASIELLVRGWNMTSDVTQAGYFRLECDSVVHFLFEDVSDVEFDGLNHQNVLSGLDFEVLRDDDGKAKGLSVELNHCYGLSGGFKAARASVVSVTPYIKKLNPPA